MKIKKSCRRKKCPLYGEISSKCALCELNPEAMWTVEKRRKRK